MRAQPDGTAALDNPDPARDHRRAVRLTIPCLALALLPACSGREPLQRVPSNATIRTQLGPAGGELRGAGGTSLEGLVLTVPLGALPHLVEVELAAADDIPFAGTGGASVGLRLRLAPDPGPLLLPATLRLPVALPEVRAATDLVVVGRKPAAAPVGVEATTRVGLIGTDPLVERSTRVASFAVQELVDLQVRLAAQPRRVGDGEALAQRALDALATGTDAGLVAADQLLAEAQRADPLSPVPGALRAFTRVAVVLNDRTDDTVGLDSVGEVATRLGLDVGRRSLWARLLAGDLALPSPIAAGAPRTSEIVAMLRARVRPVLELALDDLAQVPAATAILFRLALLEPWLPGERELDHTDLLAWRAVLLATIAVIDQAEDLDLDFDLATLSTTTVEDLLRVNSGLLRRRAPVEARTAIAAAGAAEAAFFAWRSLRNERDDQGDDVLVMPVGFDASRQEEIEASLGALSLGTKAPGTQRMTIRGFGDILVQPWLWTGPGASLEPRALLPRFDGDYPLAASLTDAELFGLLPGMTQTRAAELLDLVYVHDLPEVPIRIDGVLDEWPREGRALDDPREDVDTRGLFGVDLASVWVGRAGAALALAFTVHDGAIAPRVGQTTAYGLTLRGDARRPGPRPEIRLEVSLASGGARLLARVDGVETPLRGRVAFSGSVLEVLADVSGLPGLAVGTGVHVARASVIGEESLSARISTDSSNRVLLVR